jgi:hypothetical protein
MPVTAFWTHCLSLHYLKHFRFHSTMRFLARWALIGSQWIVESFPAGDKRENLEINFVFHPGAKNKLFSKRYAESPASSQNDAVE